MERVIAACPLLHFKQPVDVYSKTASFHSLLAAGENIVITHELFSRQELTLKILGHIQDFGYMLILDEVLEVIQPISNITQKEVRMLFDQDWIEADQNGTVRWLLGDAPVSRFRDIRARARSHALIWYDNKLLMWAFPRAMLQAFAETYILTFMFGGSHHKHYLDVYGIAYSYYHIEDGALCDGLSDMHQAKARIASLLEVYEGSLNSVGQADSALSKAWCKRHCRSQDMKVLFKNARNILMNRYGATSATAMWSCFKDERKRNELKGYAGSFCPCNARATNEHRHRTHLAYLVNVFDHPYIIRWFADHGVQLNQDAFDLSQLLQWIWRSAIRDNEAIRLYLPSRRMRKLLYRWLGKTGS